MTRRDFITTGTAFCTVTALYGVQSCNTVARINAEEQPGYLKVSLEGLKEKGWALVNSNRYPAGILLSKNEQGNYRAVLMECTHKRCEVRPTGGILLCPCHGAEFSFGGTVQKEPAEFDLFKFKTTSDDQFAYIHLPE